MRLADLIEPFREALAVHSIFQSAGVSADDIFVGYGADRVFQVIGRRGKKEFRVDVATLDLTPEKFAADWRAAVEIYNGTPQPERAVVIEKTKARAEATRMLFEMAVAGFIKRRSVDRGALN